MPLVLFLFVTTVCVRAGKCVCACALCVMWKSQSTLVHIYNVTFTHQSIYTLKIHHRIRPQIKPAYFCSHTGCRMPLTLFNTRSATPNASAFRTHKTGACKARDPHPQATTHMTERANAKNNRASARARTHAGTHPHAHTCPHERWRDGALSVRHKAFGQARAARGLVRWKRVRRPRCTRRL